MSFRDLLGALDKRLAKALDAAFAEGKRANPDIPLLRETFVGHLENALQTEADPLAALERMRIDHLYLACACAQGEPRAIARLEAEHLGQVDVAMARLRMAPFDADEIRQRVREKLLVGRDGTRRIAEFSGRGDLGYWIRAVAMRLAIDALRSMGRELPADEDALATLAAPEGDPELDHLRRHYGKAFRSALRQALQRLESTRRTELKLYYLDGLTLEDLGALHRVAPSTIARRLTRTREEILAQTRAALQAQLRIDAGELESLFGLIASRMELARSAFETASQPRPVRARRKR